VGNYRLRVVITEDHYQNPYNLNGQLNYYNVERNMLPDATGTAVDTFTDGQTQTYTFKTKLTTGVVDMGSNTFWDSMGYSHMVAFVQDDDTKGVLQSIVSPPLNPASVENISTPSNVSVYPDPASTTAYISFQLAANEKVSVRLTDISGHTIYSDMKEMNSGVQTLSIPTATLPTGLYIITIQTPAGNVVRKLNVFQ
jgi:hypothetical protein